jgi:nicotinate phosphoribosyltransferase
VAPDALLTDFYELTMACGYLLQGRLQDSATFDLYYRRNPFKGGYAVAAGLENGVIAVTEMRFTAEDIRYLKGLKSSSGSALFPSSYLDYLKDFRFRGDISAAPEGTVVFPNEPLVQVSGGLIECQLAESILLCHVNFQTLIATKAARLWEASNHGDLIEFGLRRAQGPDGALSACRAAFIGGVDATSNVRGAALLGAPAKGTHAHSWVQSFPSELESFRSFAASFPYDCVLLVDTYDVLRSGVPNAITVAKELEAGGHRLGGIRIDSGDLAFLSREARKMLDSAGLDYVKIAASNELDEFVITQIIAEGGKVDIWGVGTHLATGGNECALGGVYKLVEHNGKPKIKLSGNPEKMTNPGAKKVVRLLSQQGLMEADALAHPDEDLSQECLLVDPVNPLRRKRLTGLAAVDLLERVVHRGEVICQFPTLEEIRSRRKDQLARLHESYRRLYNPHEYKVGMTSALWETKQRVIAELSH